MVRVLTSIVWAAAVSAAAILAVVLAPVIWLVTAALGICMVLGLIFLFVGVFISHNPMWLTEAFHLLLWPFIPIIISCLVACHRPRVS